MDNLRGQFGDDSEPLGDAADYDANEDETGREAPPVAIGTDERRMQVRAYNFWAGMLQDRNLPSIEELDPEAQGDFGPFSVLLDFTSGIENPAIAYLGDQLADECGTDGPIDRLNDVPSRSLLSRITDHYLQIIANQAPIGFEAEFVNQRSRTILYRGILLPFSSDDDTIDFIYGVINWKELADQQTTDELMLQIEQALEPEKGDREVVPLADWADGPKGEDEDEDILDLGMGMIEPEEPLEIPTPEFSVDNIKPPVAADDDLADMQSPSESASFAMDLSGLDEEYDGEYEADYAEEEDEDEEYAEDEIDEESLDSDTPNAGNGTVSEDSYGSLTAYFGSSESSGDDDEKEDFGNEVYDDEDADALQTAAVPVAFDDDEAETPTATESPVEDETPALPELPVNSEMPVEDEPASEPEQPASAGPVMREIADDEMGLSDWLASARDYAEDAKASEDRSRKALYAAIGRAYDFSLAASAEPEEFAQLVEDSGLTMQERAPLTPLVKLVFGVDYDKTRIAEFASVLAHGQRTGIERGDLAAHIAKAPGGIKALVAEERRLRRIEAGEQPAERSAPRNAIAKKLRKLETKTFADIPAKGSEFTVLVARRLENGEVVLLGEIDDDVQLIERAAKKLLG